ncbi:MAG TPA: SGNH/GDSL hydrolase family protein [Verrucomicrobiae bacterium]|jgi:lysophospholipase L1-like esterase|nr:SGNH/GDSL hydrolase family protein [Verrucomicrobiae bacterium]
MKKLALVLCLLWPAFAPIFAAEMAVIPAGVHRILFLGDSITYDGRYVSDIEAYFVTRYPDREMEFINVGLPSETVSGLSEPGHAGGQFPRPDLHERLARVLEQTKPDLVFACYGMNDGIYMKFDEQRFQKFKDGMMWLHEEVTKAGAKIIHVTPPIYDGRGRNKDYNEVLNRYSAWLLAQRAAAGWDVVDVHGPMNHVFETHVAADPKFHFAEDGIHPDSFGHWIMAQAILEHLGARDISDAKSADEMVANYPHGGEVLKLIEQRQAMMKDAWLTSTHHKRPGMNIGLPLAEAQVKYAKTEKEIRDLVKR